MTNTLQTLTPKLHKCSGLPKAFAEEHLPYPDHFTSVLPVSVALSSLCGMVSICAATETVLLYPLIPTDAPDRLSSPEICWANSWSTSKRLLVLLTKKSSELSEFRPSPHLP